MIKIINSSSFPKNQVHQKDESGDHEKKDHVGSISALPSNFFEAGTAELKLLRSRSYCSASVLHRIEFILIFEHFVEVRTHFPCHIVKGLLNTGRFTITNFQVSLAESCGSVESSLKLSDDVSRHCVEFCDTLRVLFELWASFVKQVAHSFHEIRGVLVWERNVRDDGVRNHISVGVLVPRKTEVLAFGSVANTADVLVLSTKERHAVVADILILVTGDLVRSFACGKDSLVPHSSHAHKEDLTAIWCTTLNHLIRLLI